MNSSHERIWEKEVVVFRAADLQCGHTGVDVFISVDAQPRAMVLKPPWLEQSPEGRVTALSHQILRRGTSPADADVGDSGTKFASTVALLKKSI